MPLLTIISNKNFSSIEKQEIMKVATDFVIEEWNVLPDKIQVHISTVGDDEVSRGGVSPINSQFGILSRRISIKSDDYYASPSLISDVEKLVMISIDTWTGLSLVSKINLVNKLTQYFMTKHKISGDNTVIYIREIIPENWFQNSISGRNPDFLNKSREVK